jgi:hypothetical protein
LARLAEHFKLYIQGVILGIIKPRKNDFDGLDYCITIRGDEFFIGNERLIRLDGINSNLFDILYQKTASVLGQLKSPAHYAGLAWQHCMISTLSVFIRQPLEEIKEWTICKWVSLM